MAQELPSPHSLRPATEVLARHSRLPRHRLHSLEEKFSGCDNIMKTYFADGIFDRLTAQK